MLCAWLWLASSSPVSSCAILRWPSPCVKHKLSARCLSVCGYLCVCIAVTAAAEAAIHKYHLTVEFYTVVMLLTFILTIINLGKLVPERWNQSGFNRGKRWWGLGWQWHQLDHMQTICTSLQTDNHTNTSSLIFVLSGCSSWHQATMTKHRRHNNPSIKISWSIGTVKQRRQLNLRWCWTWSRAGGSDELHTIPAASPAPESCRWMEAPLLSPPHKPPQHQQLLLYDTIRDAILTCARKPT